MTLLFLTHSGDMERDTYSHLSDTLRAICSAGLISFERQARENAQVVKGRWW